ncbi:unnamed protein product [Anisakis simplex]|uniref:Transcription initiation factor TFIID subunit 4 n=1 Tax=Anisakis simplex TaxID=6269 RepID=A0A0M3KK12_ANISI|nr:unnamed protein product [Anisakis simplex]
MSSSALNGYDSNTSTSTPLLSNPTSTSTNATIQQAQQSASSVSNTVSNTMQNSPELANMTVGQLLGQTQRRNISVSHLNPNAQRLSIGPQRNQIRVVNNPNAVSISRQVGGAVGTSTPNQQPSAPERTQIS